MNEQKVPYWLSPREFQTLRETMRREGIEGMVADDVRDEIAVAKVRAKTSRISTNALIIVLGLSKGSIPVHLSDKEVSFLNELDGLPQKVKNRLA